MTLSLVTAMPLSRLSVTGFLVPLSRSNTPPGLKRKSPNVTVTDPKLLPFNWARLHGMYRGSDCRNLMSGLTGSDKVSRTATTVKLIHLSSSPPLLFLSVCFLCHLPRDPDEGSRKLYFTFAHQVLEFGGFAHIC